VGEHVAVLIKRVDMKESAEGPVDDEHPRMARVRMLGEDSRRIIAPSYGMIRVVGGEQRAPTRGHVLHADRPRPSSISGRTKARRS
jgi:hypothetical protein